MPRSFKNPQDFCRRAVRKAKREAGRLGRAVAGRKMLTVVIPLYNAMPYFEKTIESILGQTYDLREVEVLIMDDGSTDGSLEYAREIAAAHPGLIKVVECGRNGGPSVPRNMGIERARGKYIFFCDADDYFGEDAFRRMIGHAEEWHSDVLLVKVSSPDGREIPTAAFRKGNQPKVDIYESDAFGTLGPIKLFRRSVLRANRITFPPEVRLREDEVFTSRVYFAASVISVAADMDYYAVTARDDGQNLFETERPSIEGDLFVLETLLDIVEKQGDSSRADGKVYPRIFRSSWMACAKALSEMRYEGERRDAFAKPQAVTGPYYERDFVGLLPSSMRMLFKALEQGDLDFFIGLASAIELTPNGSFFRYRVLEDDVVEEDGRVFWSQKFAGSEYTIEVSPSKVFRAERASR